MSQTTQDFSVLDNISLARLNMIESQIRAGGITNRKVLAAMKNVHREIFISTPEGALAYAEIDAKVQNSNRYLLNPPLLARLIDAADIHDGDLVLDIGCANGYSTAILSDLVNIGTVVGLEIEEDLIVQANQILEMLGKNNIVIEHGNLNEGFALQAPYDVIILNGASAIPPAVLEEVFVPQLRMNGRFVGVFDDGGDIKGEAWRWTKTKTGLRYEALFAARAPILPGFEPLPVSFKFPGLTAKKPFINIKQGLSSIENDEPIRELKWQEKTKTGQTLETLEPAWPAKKKKALLLKPFQSKLNSLKARAKSAAAPIAQIENEITPSLLVWPPQDKKNPMNSLEQKLSNNAMPKTKAAQKNKKRLKQALKNESDDDK